MFSFSKRVLQRISVGATCLTSALLFFTAVPVSAQTQASADIQLTADNTLSTDAISVEAEPGQTVIIEIYGTGFNGAQGVQATLLLSDPSAIASVEGSHKISGFSFPPAANQIAAWSAGSETIKFGSGGLGGATEAGTDLKLVGTVNITLASGFKTLTVTMTSFQVGADPAITVNVPLTVVNPSGLPKTVTADLNDRPGDQNQTTSRVNPGRAFPIQVFGGGLRNTTGYEIHATVDNVDNFNLTKARFVTSPSFVITPASGGSGGALPAPVASSSARGGIDIASGNSGDGAYNAEHLSVAGAPGGNVAIEIFGGGFSEINGITITLELSNASAVSSVAGQHKLSGFNFPPNPITFEPGSSTVVFQTGAIFPASAGEGLSQLGSVILTLGSDISSGLGITVKTISFQTADSEDVVTTNAVLNVTSGGAAAPVASVEVSGNTLIAKATAPEPVKGTVALGGFSLTTNSSFRGGQVTISQVIFTSGETSETIEPGIVLQLKSIVSDAPVVVRPPVPVTVTDTRAIIKWETNVNSSGKLLYGTDRNNLDQEVETGSQGRVHTVRLSGLTLGTPYFFQVTNSDEKGTSEAFPPQPAQFVTRSKVDDKPPRVLRGPVVFGITENRADVVLETDEAVVIEVSYGTDQTALSQTVSRTSSELAHKLTLESLTAGTQYFYRVKATDLNGNDATSDIKNFSTLSGADTRPPQILGRPSVLGRSFNATVVQWFTDEASNSTLFYGTSAEALTGSVATDEATRNHKVSVGNLLAGVQYFYQVKSADASGNEASSPVFDFTTNTNEDTQAPSFVRLPIVPSRSNTEVRIVFETNEPTTASIQYATSSDVYADDTGTVGETANATNAARKHAISLTNLEASTQYFYKVSITDLASNGPTTNPGQLSFATRALADSAPPIVFSRPVAQGITSSGAVIRWGADEPHSAVIRFGPVAAGKQTTSADLTESVEDIDFSRRHAVTLSDLTAGTAYAYEVETTDAAGNTSTSTNLSFTTESGVDTSSPVILSGPVARNITSTTATIIWRTDEISDSRVSWGTTTVYTETLEDATGVGIHSVTLTDLKAGTVYHYAVGSADQSGNVITTDVVGTVIGLSKDHTFRTLAADDTDAPVILSGPIIRSRDDDTAVIEWRTDELSTSQVAIGIASGTNAAAGTPVFGETSQLVFEDNELVIRHSVTVTGLTGGLGYLFQVSSTDAANHSVSSVQPTVSSKLQPPGGLGSFTTSTESDTQFPVITSGPTVLASSSNSLTISWETDESANSLVDFGASSSGAAKQTTTTLTDQKVDGTNVTGHQIVLTNLTAGTTYSYEVSSTDASGNGATRSKTAFGTTASEVDLTAPVISTTPAVIYKTDRSATIQWVTNEVATSEVSYGTSATELINVRSNPDFETEHTVTLTNLSAGTEYHFQASSADQNNNGPAQSSVISFSTESTPDTQNPTVSDVAVSAVDNSATVTWITDEVADSAVRFGTTSGTYDFNAGDATDVTGHSVTLTNLQPNTTYFYVVESIDQSSNGPAKSTEASFTTVATGDVQAPQAPSGLVVSGGNSAVKLFWSASASSGITGYTVERGTDGTFSPVASLEAVTSYIDNNVANGTAYTYRVLAVGAQQLSSEASAPSDAVTPSAGSGPGAPTLYGIQGTATAPTVVINNGTPLNASDVLSYTFHIATSSDFSDAITVAAGIASGAGLGSGDPAGVTAWTVDRTLTEGTTYHYRIKGSDGAFDTAFLSGSFTVDSTAPEFPGDLTGDRSVGFGDFLSFVGSFNKSKGDDGFIDGADLSRDGKVGFGDFLAFVGVFNKKYIKGPSSGKIITPLVYGVDATAKFQLSGRHINAAQATGELAVDIRLSDVTNLKGYGVQVNYDPATVQFVDASANGETFLNSGDREAELFGILSHDAEKGEVFVTGAITQGKTVSGEGTLATLKFRLIGSDPQSALIEIAQGLLIDGKLNPSAAQNLGQRFALLPTEYALEHNFPNPFNPETTIRYAVPDAGKVTLVIYSVLGQEIARLVDSDLLPGFYTVRWDGKDAMGRGVASGIYLYRMQAGDFTNAHKMLLLK